MVFYSDVTLVIVVVLCADVTFVVSVVLCCDVTFWLIENVFHL